MKVARIDDIKRYVDLKNETQTYVYLVNWVWMLEKEVKDLLRVWINKKALYH